METSRPSDTIDLSKAFLRLIRLLSENILTVVITLVVCLGAGWLYFWMTPKTFESKMIIQSDILSESYSLKLAENLNTHIKDFDNDFLATSLNLSKNEALMLKEFKIVSALTPTSQQMPEKDKIIIVISVRVMNNDILPKLQKGIIHYFSDNEYIKKRVDENRRKYEGLINSLNQEIKKLDTLKIKIARGEFPISKAGSVSLMDISGPYRTTIDLEEKKYDFMIDLATVDSIQIIDNFTPYGKPVWPKLSIILIVSLSLAGLIIFIILSYKAFNSQSIK